MNKALIAEFWGTFVLGLMVALSVTGSFVVPTPLLAAMVLGLFVYMIGGISGCHINPAVSIGLWSVGKLSKDDLVKYVAAQFLAAVAVIALLSVWSVEMMEITPRHWEAEFLGMMLFTFGIGAAVFGKHSASLSGLIVGGSLFIGIAISALGGGPGILNPAVGATLQVFDVVYWLAEIVGAVAGFGLAKYMFESVEK